ncbi:MAG TPA: glycoside hydrolase family 3 C-terminal domain-containing protein [Verrucomicrobiae bacterium]|jgi:beta-glucosidase|nr:glycoside hydrolase family 3 C-terminal domain-containing protein [Verrucomicrobiae bacterium]
MKPLLKSMRDLLSPMSRRLQIPRFLIITILPGLLVANVFASPLVYQDHNAPLEARVDDLFSRLTQDEKIGLLSGTGFTTQPIPRLGVPALAMVDAGQGIRGGQDSTRGPATAFPAEVLMASSWDTNLVWRIGQAIGEEALNKGSGAQMVLGPAVNIQRSPLGGRDGEYFCEDPYFTARLAVNYIQGLQSSGCAACVKHYVAYNQERDRYTIDVDVTERALGEIYFPAFEAAVKEGHAWAVMSSYNQINGYKATANQYLMVDVLKKGWGFDGLLLSDWGGVQDTVGPLNAGNDLEMPGQEYMTHDRVEAALTSGRVTQASIDESVHRILRAIIRVGLLDKSNKPDHSIVNSAEHQQLCLQAATEGIVLLKNGDQVLPLDDRKIHSIACIGAAASDWEIGAAGSPQVVPFYSISALDGLRKRAGNAIQVNDSAGERDGSPVPPSALQFDGKVGLHGEYFANRNLEGAPVVVRNDSQIQFDWSDKAPAPNISQSAYSVRWTGTLTPPLSGEYKLLLTADDGCRLYLDGKLLIDHWVDSAASAQVAQVDFTANQPHQLRVEYFQHGGQAVARLNWARIDDPPYADAIEAAKKSDVALVFVSTKGTEGEGSDRPSMTLPNAQDDLIRAVAGVNKKTIVVLNNGAPVLMPWLDDVAGVIETWFPGEEGGNALATILFGDSNPSGKLPTTFAARREDYPDFGNFPGRNGHVHYAEGIYVGYRHFDKADIKPLFPFGYGLSYTSFAYSQPRLSEAMLAANGTVTLTLNVKNTGSRAGAEVVQLYVHAPDGPIDRPLRELKGFARVELEPGETKTVSFDVQPQLLACCDVAGKQWRADAGTYELQVGASSRDIRVKVPLVLSATYLQPIPFLAEQTSPTPAEGDLAAFRPVVSSSEAPNSEYGSEPRQAVDGNTSTYWKSKNSDSQWLAVDLGEPRLVDRVRLTWATDRFGDSFASAYAIQLSSDGKTWNEVYQTTKGQGGVETNTFSPTSARWVRVFCTKRAANQNYKMVSLEVFAPSK